MKVKALLVGLLVLSVVMLGCRSVSVPGADSATRQLVTFQATGSSVIAKPDDPLALVEAREAAALLAKASLLAKVKGEYMTQTVRVGDLMFSSQEAAASVEGILARAKVSFRAPEARVPEPRMVTAVATLELTRDELENIGEYVE